MKKIMLDTGAYAQYLNGDEKVLNAIVRADAVYLSVFVLGELYGGFKSGTKEVKNRELLERFLQKPTVGVLQATTETAEIYSEIISILKTSGAALPANAIWIAAQALETGSLLVTGDVRYRHVPGLRLWDQAGF